MAKTKGEYLQSLRAQADRAQKGNTLKRRLRAWVMAALVCIGSAIGIRYEMGASATRQVSSYEDYKNSTDAMVSVENLAYEDTFEIWNSRDIGNDVNTLLSGGELYVGGPVKVIPSLDFTSMEVTLKSGEMRTLPIPGSSLNVVGDTLIFRNDSTRNIHAYSLISGEDSIICDGNAGEVFVSDECVYYIDFGDGFSVKSMNLDGSGVQKILDCPVQSFVVLGNTIIYLDTDQSLFRTQLNEYAPQCLVNNIERFFIGEKIYAESNNTVFSFSAAGSDAEEVYVSEYDDLRLIGYQEDGLFFQEGGALKCLKGGTVSTVCPDNYVLYRSLDIDSSGGIACVGFKDASTREILAIKSVSESGGSEDGE